MKKVFAALAVILLGWWMYFMTSITAFFTDPVEENIYIESGDAIVLSFSQQLESIEFSKTSWFTVRTLEGGEWRDMSNDISEFQPLNGYLIRNFSDGELHIHARYASVANVENTLFQKSLRAGWNLVWIAFRDDTRGQVLPSQWLGDALPYSQVVDFTGIGIGTVQEWALYSWEAILGSPTNPSNLVSWNLDIRTRSDLDNAILYENLAYGVFVNTDSVIAGSQQINDLSDLLGDLDEEEDPLWDLLDDLTNTGVLNVVFDESNEGNEYNQRVAINSFNFPIYSLDLQADNEPVDIGRIVFTVQWNNISNFRDSITSASLRLNTTTFIWSAVATDIEIVDDNTATINFSNLDNLVIWSGTDEIELSFSTQWDGSPDIFRVIRTDFLDITSTVDSTDVENVFINTPDAKTFFISPVSLESDFVRWENTANPEIRLRARSSDSTITEVVLNSFQFDISWSTPGTVFNLVSGSSSLSLSSDNAVNDILTFDVSSFAIDDRTISTETQTFDIALEISIDNSVLQNTISVDLLQEGVRYSVWWDIFTSVFPEVLEITRASNVSHDTGFEWRGSVAFSFNPLVSQSVVFGARDVPVYDFELTAGNELNLDILAFAVSWAYTLFSSWATISSVNQSEITWFINQDIVSAIRLYQWSIHPDNLVREVTSGIEGSTLIRFDANENTLLRWDSVRYIVTFDIADSDRQETIWLRAISVNPSIRDQNGFSHVIPADERETGLVILATPSGRLNAAFDDSNTANEDPKTLLAGTNDQTVFSVDVNATNEPVNVSWVVFNITGPNIVTAISRASLYLDGVFIDRNSNSNIFSDRIEFTNLDTLIISQQSTELELRIETFPIGFGEVWQPLSNIEVTGVDFSGITGDASQEVVADISVTGESQLFTIAPATLSTRVTFGLNTSNPIIWIQSDHGSNTSVDSTAIPNVILATLRLDVSGTSNGTRFTLSNVDGTDSIIREVGVDDVNRILEFDLTQLSIEDRTLSNWNEELFELQITPDIFAENVTVSVELLRDGINYSVEWNGFRMNGFEDLEVSNYSE